MERRHFKRIMLKISGEALAGDQKHGIDLETIRSLAREIKELKDTGAEIALVNGGGNIFRGIAASASGMDRAQADYMGMMATVINSLALQDALEKEGLSTRVMSAITMQAVAEPYIRRRAERHLQKGRIVIFTAGTGNPYFTTDMAACLRANEIHAEVVCKATKVKGVYDSDPMTNPNAVLHKHLTYDEVLSQNLRVMDASAIALCRDNNLPIIVFSMKEKGNICRVAHGESIGTFISSKYPF